MVPTAADVLTFLGESIEEGQDVSQVEAVIATAKAMVKAYTRGGGFMAGGTIPESDVEAVIISCAARLYRNPSLDRNQTVGPFQTSPGVFNGWSLPELAVLHRYRTRAL